MLRLITGLILFSSISLSAQVFNRSKAFRLWGGHVQHEFLGTRHLVSAYDGSSYRFQLYSAQGDSLSESALYLSGTSYEQSLLALDSNHFLFSYYELDGCDLWFFEERITLLFNDQLQIIDTLRHAIGSGGLPLKEAKLRPWQDSLVLLSARNGFEILSATSAGIQSLYDTIFNLSADLKVQVMRGDSLLLQDLQGGLNSPLQVFRYSDTSYQSLNATIVDELFPFDPFHLATIATNGLGFNLYDRADLSTAGSRNLAWNHRVIDLNAYPDRLIFIDQKHYALYDPAADQILDTGTFYNSMQGLAADVSLKDSSLVGLASAEKTEFQLEARRIGRPGASVFQGLSYRLEAISGPSFDAIFRNNSNDTIRKIGVGIRNGASTYQCQSGLTRSIRDGLALAPGDSLRLTYQGSPFYYGSGSGAADQPFYLYMVNDNIVREGERLAQRIVLDLEKSPVGKLSIYPNPCRDQLQIESWGESSHLSTELRIFSVKGRPLLEKQVDLASGVPQSVDLKQLASGIYILELKGGAERHRQVLIKR